MKNIPETIYLQTGEDTENIEDFNQLEGVTWCKDRINESDLEYVRKRSPWISVKDMLPEEGQMVFALTQREGIFYIRQETFYRQKYLDGYGKWIHGNSRVLAWTPIPSFDEILEANKDVLQRIKGNGD